MIIIIIIINLKSSTDILSIFCLKYNYMSTNKHFYKHGTAEKNYNIQGDIRTLLERDCEVEKEIKFLRDIEIVDEMLT